ncbi:MAG: hypothetical protein EOP51_04535 [Sphingobacteriales bacterium]|nr:MAG: hypothetical protein EOP51_04535 [Sphingobacteriales bacterium]
MFRIEHAPRPVAFLLLAFDTTGREMGRLPSRYNYLADCIEHGYSFTGKVIASSLDPFVSVIIDVTPHEPAS